MRRLALVCGFVALLLACGTVEGPGALGPSPSAIASKLPQPIAQPITRKDPGAQVAWVWTYAGEKRWLVAVDPGRRDRRAARRRRARLCTRLLALGGRRHDLPCRSV